MNEIITAEIAYRIRDSRGLLLPAIQIYATERLQEIALELREAYAKIDALDSELRMLAEKELQEKETI